MHIFRLTVSKARVAALTALLPLFAACERKDPAVESAPEPTLSSRAAEAADKLQEAGSRAMQDAKTLAADWSAKLAAGSVDLREKVGDLLESAKTSTADLGDNAKAKMDELAALMPEIKEQAATLERSSGDAAKAAGDKLHALMARAESLYRDLAGSTPATAP
jgi:hypothetical protein